MACKYFIGDKEYTEREIRQHLYSEYKNYADAGLVDLSKIFVEPRVSQPTETKPQTSDRKELLKKVFTMSEREFVAKSGLPEQEAKIFYQDNRNRVSKSSPLDKLGDISNIVFPTSVQNWMAKQDFGKLIKKYLTTSGLVGKDVYDIWLKEQAKAKAIVTQMDWDTKDLIAEIKKHNKESSDYIGSERINMALQDEEVRAALPDNIGGKVLDMRNNIDHLSTVLKQEGFIPANMEARFDENIGLYLNTSYQIFNNPEYKVTDEVFNGAVSAILDGVSQKKTQVEGLINEIKTEIGALEQIQFKNPIEGAADEVGTRIQALRLRKGKLEEMLVKYDQFSKEDAEIEVKQLLHSYKNDKDFLKAQQLTARDISILKQKKDIDPRIQALLGLETDGLLNYARTLTKQANLLAQSRFLREVAEHGQKTGVLTKEPTQTNYVDVDFKNAGKFYTTPEFEEAIKTFNEPIANPKGLVGKTLYALQALNLHAKLFKTVLSIESYPRNFIGGVINNLNNGRVGLKYYNKSFQLAKALLNGSKESRKNALELIEKGVLNDGFLGAEMQEMAKKVYKTQEEIYNTLPEGGKVDVENTIKKYIKLKDVAGKIYNGIDDFNKAVAYYTEKQVYLDAGFSEEQASDKAADIIRNTMPTYSQVPLLVKEIRKSGVIGSFVSFTSEIIRTEKNTLKLIKEELQSENKELKKMAAKRIAGHLMVYYLGGEAIRFMANQFLDLEDEEKLQKVRRFLPEWEKDANLFFTSLKDGNISFVNVSQTDPYSYFKDLYNVFMYGDKDMQDKVIATFDKLSSPFIDPALGAVRFFEVVMNHNITNGRKIYLPTDDFIEKINIGLSHIEKGLEFGTKKTIQDTWKAATGETDQYGNMVTWGDIFAAVVLGQRSKTRDIKTSAGRIMQSRALQFQEAENLYNPSRNYTTEQRKEARNRAEMNIIKVVSEARKDYNALCEIVGVQEANKITRASLRRNKYLMGAVINGNSINFDQIFKTTQE